MHVKVAEQSSGSQVQGLMVENSEIREKLVATVSTLSVGNTC